MKEMKRVLSLLLCFVMVLGLLPITALAADDSSAHYLMFATDRHSNTSIIGNLLTKMESVVGDGNIEYVGLGGDMVNGTSSYNTSTVLSEVTAVCSNLDASTVDLVYASSHDVNNTDDAEVMNKSSGLLYTGEDYYVYGVTQDDMQQASAGSTAASAFKTWVDGLDANDNRVIIVLSHVPIHAQRGDNYAATYWNAALNYAATGEESLTADSFTVKRNVVFLHGHNHTTDSKEYFYAVGSTIFVQTTSSSSSKTLSADDYDYYAEVYDPELVTEDDTSTYAGPGGSSGTGGNSTATGTNAVIGYTYLTAGYLNANSDATLMTITDSTITFDKYTTSSYSTLGTVTRIVNETESKDVTVTIGSDNKGIYTGVTSGAVEVVTDKEYVTTAVSGLLETGYVAYDITLEGYTTGTTATVTLPIPENVTDPAVYYVPESGDAEQMTITGKTDSTVTFTTTHFSTFVVGQAASTGSGETTTVEKEVYVLVDSLTVGKDYLIANGNSGAVTLLGQSSGNATTTTATVVTEGGYTYIETADSAYVWNATKHTNSSASGPRLINDGYAMFYSNGLSISNSYSAGAGSTRYWTYSDSELSCPSTNSSSTTYYLTYSNSSFSMTGSSTTGIYIYEKQTINVSGSGSDSGDSGDSGNTGGVEGEDFYNETVTTGTTSYAEKTIYVLTSTLTSGKEYLIVNKNSDGTGYALINNNGSVGSSAVTINASGSTAYYTDANGSSVYTASAPYIISDVSAWTVGTSSSSSSNYTFKNGDYYLATKSSNNNRSLTLSSSSTSWTKNGNTLYYKSSNTSRNSYYLCYSSNSWGVSTSTSNVYFYEKVTVYEETSTETQVTYSVSAADITHYIEDAEDPGSENITASILGNGTAVDDLGGNYSYEVVDGTDTSNIISEIATDGTITFTGKTGTAKVKVSYTFTVGNTEYVIWRIINVTAKAPGYEAHIYQVAFDEATDVTSENFSSGTYYTYNSSTGWYTEATSYAEGTTYYTYHAGSYGEDVCDDAFYLKGVYAGRTYALLSDLKYVTGDGETSYTDYTSVEWSVSDTNIATIRTEETGYGKLTFTGNKGTVVVTVSYTVGGTVYTASTTISVTPTAYFVPSDGTDDFPEYPNQGAIRFDKTASAVGNFSQTGIAKVELSMTGVPYSTGSEIDVVVMLDMTGSMTSDSMNAAEKSAIAFAKQIVINEDGTYNDNRIAVLCFSTSNVYTLWSLNSVTAETYSSLVTAIEGASEKQASGSTQYSNALSDCYEILYAASRADGYDRQQFCVFVSDGTPTSVKYITGTGSGTTTVSFTQDGTTYTQTVPDYTTGSTAATFYASGSTYHEYWSQLMINNGVTVYGVYTSAAAGSSGSSGSGGSVNDTASGTIAMNNVASSSNNVYVVNDYTDTSALTGVFTNIAKEIREAATDVVVEDKIADEYTMTFKLPNTGVTTDDVGMEEFYIQVVEYVLDEQHERTSTCNVLENFTFDANGTLKSHTVDGVACGDSCSHVTFTNGVVTAITGTYFKYYITENGAEMLEWTAEKLTSNELALQYFVYLDNSAGVDAESQVDAGTYPTNEYATITYTNVNKKRCQQEFPIPQLTWNGAQVTYVFYLVNENGQPVNRAGRVVDFANAVYVTTPVTYAVTWNAEEGVEHLEAAYLAQQLVPDVYELYDADAEYTIRVYQTEGVDENGQNWNYFQIAGSDTVTSKTTTKVYNTKAGTKYADYGVYSAKDVGTNLSAGDSDTVTVTTQVTDFDYANTTVAFAVVWTPTLKEDTVVIDFGLDVVIDVIANDAVNGTVTGIMNSAPDAEINKGSYSKSVGEKEITGDFWKAGSESGNNNAVRFSVTNTQFHEAVTFYYEASVTYLAEENTYNTAYMYSSVTVIPASTIYYEDSFLTLASYTKNDDGDYDEDETPAWAQDGTTISATQDVDRPGADQIGNGYDADNVYGYDSAYTTCSKYSLGSAVYMDVTADTRGEATFSFYGTGFDIIGLTSNTSGTLIIQVKDSTGTSVRSTIVDTYYGYTYSDEDGWQVAESTDPNALYQVPVMKISGLEYGCYTVTLIAGYNSAFDHTEDENSYRLYLDAVRIYDPAGVVDGESNETVSGAYTADNENAPEYFEVRNQIIDASGVTVDEDGNVTFPDTDTIITSGAIFIDGIAENASITNYVNYGPNNEVYLAKDQSIAFKISAENVADIQIALKLASGDSVTCTINGKTFTIQTATDLYYSILDLIGEEKLVTIRNTSDAILSITNIKVTHTENTATATSLYMDEAGATAVVQSLMAIGQVAENPEEIPEETEEPTEETEEPTEDATEETEAPTENATGETEEPTEEIPEETQAPTEEPQPDQEKDNVITTIISNVVNAISKLLKKWFP